MALRCRLQNPNANEVVRLSMEGTAYRGSHCCKCKRFFLHKPESIQAFVKTVDGMGFNRKSKMFLSAIRTVSSMSEENWELKLELFRSLGFSEKDILDVFRRVPQVFAVSERKIKER
ncbi:uncharacterized protein LOC121259537 isoform X6 [Juglans microcarpa x Juglans regia]|uniref:uncharacterized protein LOC121259537 isoform X6 n=1 Tax=Juglans microcarpa x Juglans regia TaxID=2249226 RepID=UPI001B7F3FC8|nr:uncharacterized protein LOC121259537 isoform X6 [Juglans microcarpa x Juglans regia]